MKRKQLKDIKLEELVGGEIIEDLALVKKHKGGVAL